MNKVVMSANWFIMGLCFAGAIVAAVADNSTAAIWATTCLLQTVHNQIIMSTIEKNEP